MHPPNRDASECPDGYRQYVYRINVSLPSKFPQVEPHRRQRRTRTRHEPDTGSDTITDVNTGLPLVPDDKKKKKEEEKKTT